MTERRIDSWVTIVGDARAERDLVLSIEDLTLDYHIGDVSRRVIDGFSLNVAAGEIYSLVGESGCGKSSLGLSVVGYLPPNADIPKGRVMVRGRDIQVASRSELRDIRRSEVSMVYQDPGAALNPGMAIGKQLAECFRFAGTRSERVMPAVVQALDEVQIRRPRDIVNQYPHELSGGMRQRVVIAMALAKEPSLLVLDEPTTGLDSTVEAEVMDVILQLQESHAMSILFISHNLPLVASFSHRVGVIYAGRLVEEGSSSDVFRRPDHPYTRALLSAAPPSPRAGQMARLTPIPGTPPSAATHDECAFAPRCAYVAEICRIQQPELLSINSEASVPRAPHNHASRCHFRTADLVASETMFRERHLGDRSMSGYGDTSHEAETLLSVENLSVSFRHPGGSTQALRGVSVEVGAGETLGVVGESGSGKSTLAASIVGLVSPDEGVVRLHGKPLSASVHHRSATDTGSIGMVFQNPASSLNRRHSIERILRRAIKVQGGASREGKQLDPAEVLNRVRVPTTYLPCRPGHLSGGLKQRISIARAFCGEPELIICDEPTSSLDVSVQAAILNLLKDLQNERGVSYVFISHDLRVVRYMADRLAVLYAGQIVESGLAFSVFSGPNHPYTELLLDGKSGTTPDQSDTPQTMGSSGSMRGCVFSARCPRKIGSICDEAAPPQVSLQDEHSLRCHLPLTELGRSDSFESIGEEEHVVFESSSPGPDESKEFEKEG